MADSQLPRHVTSRAAGGETVAECAEYSASLGLDHVVRQKRVGLSAILSSDRYSVERCYKDGALEGYHQLGNTVFTPAGLTQAHAFLGGRATAICCFWEPQWVRGVLGGDFGWDAQTLRSTIDIADTDIQHMLRRVYQETVNPGFCTDMILDGLGRSLLGLIARYLWGLKTEPADRAVTVSPSVISRTKEFIDASLHLGLTTSMIADAVGMSRGHLMRQFKTATGRTLHGYVEDMRTMRAKALLADADLPIKEISFRVGFHNPSSFSAAFAQKTGVSPQDYRKHFHIAPYRARGTAH